MPRTRLALRALGLLLAANSVSSGYQAWEGLARGGQPAALLLAHAGIAALGVVGLAGLWQVRLWGPRAVAAWAMANAILIVSLPALIDLPRASWPGLGLSALAVLVVGMLLARWATRATLRLRGDERAAAR